MFKTVNNWICKRFIRHLFNGNYRACINMYSNFFDRLDVSIQHRMLWYFFNELITAYDLVCLDYKCVFELDFIDKDFSLASVYSYMLSQHAKQCNLVKVVNYAPCK